MAFYVWDKCGFPLLSPGSLAVCYKVPESLALSLVPESVETC